MHTKYRKLPKSVSIDDKTFSNTKKKIFHFTKNWLVCTKHKCFDKLNLCINRAIFELLEIIAGRWNEYLSDYFGLRNRLHSSFKYEFVLRWRTPNDSTRWRLGYNSIRSSLSFKYKSKKAHPSTQFKLDFEIKRSVKLTLKSAYTRTLLSFKIVSLFLLCSIDFGAKAGTCFIDFNRDTESYATKKPGLQFDS